MLQTIHELDSLLVAGDPVVGILYALLLFVAGAVVASFSGLVAFRFKSLDDGQSALRAISFPPSRCESCGRMLTALELVPVIGWIVCRGRCPTCGAKIPLRYPVTEFLTGAAFASVPFVAGGLAPALPTLFILAIGFLIAVIDWENSIVPEELTWVLMFAGLLASPVEPDLHYRVVGAAIGALGGWFMTTVPGWMRGVDTRAWGDVAMAAGVGAWMGCFAGYPVLFAAAALHLAICVANGAGGKDEQVWTPFGPALMAAFAAAMVFHPWMTGIFRPFL
jgi:Type II secretory pathway, prepilin signal peptidase PulO and related peptidases